VTALEEHEKIKAEKIRNLAIAVRAGSLDNESWETFLKES